MSVWLFAILVSSWFWFEALEAFFLAFFCLVLLPSVDGTLLIVFPFLLGVISRRAVLWLVLGGFLLSNGTKRGLEDCLVDGGHVLRFLELTTFLLAGPVFPLVPAVLGVPASPSCCPLVLWGFSMHSCCGVWALPVLHLFGFACSAASEFVFSCCGFRLCLFCWLGLSPVF